MNHKQPVQSSQVATRQAKE